MQVRNSIVFIIMIFVSAVILSCSNSKVDNVATISDVKIEETKAELSAQEKTNELLKNISEKVTSAKTMYDYPKDYTSDQMDGIFFGNYYSKAYGTNEKEPIEWLILEKNKDSVLLISKYILDHMPYDNRPYDEYLDNFDCNWEDSLVRRWLNTKFYAEAFDDIEKELILDTYTDNGFGSDISYDKLSILSDSDFRGMGILKKPITGQRIVTKGTEYAKTVPFDSLKYDDNENYHKELSNISFLEQSEEAKIFKGGMSCYWLRTNHQYNNIDYVWYTGELDAKYGAPNTFSYDPTVGVRPIISLRFDSMKLNEIEKQKQNEKILKDTNAKNRSFDKLSFNQIINDIVPSAKYEEAVPIDDYPTIQFGSYYYQKNDADRRPIDWIVLNKNEETKEALLMSKYILDYKKFNDGYETKVSWDRCSLRTWLNTEFLNKAFSNVEMSVIVDKTLMSEIKFATSISTIDKVFCLSHDECKDYFPEYDGRYKKDYGLNIAPLTDYAIYISDDKIQNDNGVGNYWLRDLSSLGDEIEYMTSEGFDTFTHVSSNRYETIGVRPAIWVKYQ